MNNEEYVVGVFLRSLLRVGLGMLLCIDCVQKGITSFTKKKRGSGESYYVGSIACRLEGT